MLYHFFLHLCDDPRDRHSFPTRRSSDLLSLLPDGGIAWLDASGPKGNIVLSTRLRLARNLQGHVFSQRRVESTMRSEEHTSELQSRRELVCRLLLEKKKPNNTGTA